MAVRFAGASGGCGAVLRKTIGMRSAFALRIFSGRIIYNRAMPGGLRTARHCVFTGGVVEENGSCSAAFCESAARRKSAADFQLAEPSPSSLRDATSPEGGGFALLAARSRKAPLSGELARRKPCLRGFSQANVLRPLSQCRSALTALPLGEVSPKVTERARPLRKSAGGTERTLSVIAARCHLPRKGEVLLCLPPDREKLPLRGSWLRPAGAD